jgi:hypothetical protein
MGGGNATCSDKFPARYLYRLACKAPIAMIADDLLYDCAWTHVVPRDPWMAHNMLVIYRCIYLAQPEQVRCSFKEFAWQ